jgi:hypothetical protein
MVTKWCAAATLVSQIAAEFGAVQGATEVLLNAVEKNEEGKDLPGPGTVPGFLKSNPCCQKIRQLCVDDSSFHSCYGFFVDEVSEHDCSKGALAGDSLCPFCNTDDWSDTAPVAVDSAAELLCSQTITAEYQKRKLESDEEIRREVIKAQVIAKKAAQPAYLERGQEEDIAPCCRTVRGFCHNDDDFMVCYQRVFVASSEQDQTLDCTSDTLKEACFFCSNASTGSATPSVDITPHDISFCLVSREKPGDHEGVLGQCFYPLGEKSGEFPGLPQPTWRTDVSAMDIPQSDLVQDLPWWADSSSSHSEVFCDRTATDLRDAKLTSDIWAGVSSMVDHVPADGKAVCVRQTTFLSWALHVGLPRVFKGNTDLGAKPTVYITMRADKSVVSGTDAAEEVSQNLQLSSWRSILQSEAIKAVWSMNLYHYHEKLKALPIGVRSEFAQEVAAVRRKRQQPLKCLVLVGFGDENPIRAQVIKQASTTWKGQEHIAIRHI